MSKARNLADVISGAYDVPAEALDNVEGLPDAIDVNASAPADSLAIDASGNVGIGTIPTKPLHIYGNSANNHQIRLQNAFGSGADWTLNAYGANGTLYVGNTADRLVIDSAGRVTMPYQPSFLAYRNGGNVYATSIGSAATDAFPFDATQHNVGNHYSTSTSQFTAPVDGVYAFSVHFRVDQANAYIHGCICVNNSFSIGGLTMRMISNNVSTTFQETTASVTIKLSANDTVHVVPDDGALTGGSTTFQNGQCWFSGTLIG